MDLTGVLRTGRISFAFNLDLIVLGVVVDGLDDLAELDVEVLVEGFE